MRFSVARIVAAVSFCVLVAFVASRPALAVDFNRDVRPILTENCLACHGPDASHRKASLRLDQREGAIAPLEGGRRAIVPGDSAASELLARINHADPEHRMPHIDSGKTLTPAQRDTLRKWIDAGAEYAPHWAFVAPVRAELPAVGDAGWPRNAIDRFVLARLDAEKLAPSPEADKRTLIRRVTMDLTGLPPTPGEIAAFVADDSPDAYERLVDRLLASPHYGERMAWDWLNAARYADTAGYQNDPTRPQWPWRDWVVDALNANMPFDRFTIEQIAGDLLPGATPEQKLATAFNRNHMHNAEGGRIAEETRVENVFDRAETVATVWMGLTFQCARCHNHKFDPIAIDEYFSLYDFFNQSSEAGLIEQRNEALAPSMAYRPSAQKHRLDALDARIADARAAALAPDPALDAAQAAWEASAAARIAGRWRPLTPVAAESTNGVTLSVLPDASVRAGGPNPPKATYTLSFRVDASPIVALRLEALTDGRRGAGRTENGNAVLSEFEATIQPLDDPAAAPVPVRFIAARADHAQTGLGIEQAIDGRIDAVNGWGLDGHVRPEARTALFFLDEPLAYPGGARITVRLRFETKHVAHVIGHFRIAASGDGDLAAIGAEPWHVVGPLPMPAGGVPAMFEHVYPPERGVDLAASIGGRTWAQKPNLADGRVHPLSSEVGVTYLHRVIHAPSDRRIKLALGSDDAIKLWVNAKAVHANNIGRAAAADQDFAEADLVAGENRVLMKIINTGGPSGFYFRTIESVGEALPSAVADAVAVAPADRTVEQTQAVREHYRLRVSAEGRGRFAAVDKLAAERAALQQSIAEVKVMVMDTRDKPRDTFVLSKGLYNKPTETKVTAGTPAALPPLPADAPRDRLTLARWLVAPEHPLTARVTVNRQWQLFFGAGLVKTPDDFGLQGAPPSHPQLLDWLAVEFVESGWDVKRMHKLIVTSATYRQRSAVSPDLAERDPGNALLARGPRYRWPSWMLRDQALAAAGLLVPVLGGPPVRPYQPPGVWEEATFGTKRYERDNGEALYRRSLYTFWRRIIGPTMFFDEAKRQTCEVKPNLTNTPLHALTTLNETAYVEAARALAELAIKSAPAARERWIAFAFERLTARPANDAELALLTARLEKLIAHYDADADARDKLLAVGDSERDPAVDPTAHAALTALCNLLLNLDETLSKQ